MYCAIAIVNQKVQSLVGKADHGPEQMVPLEDIESGGTGRLG